MGLILPAQAACKNAAGSDPAVFAVGKANHLPQPPSNNVWVNRLTVRACCKVHKGRVGGSELQHHSQSHPPRAPALPAAGSRGRGEGYCGLRSSACFIHGSLRPARVFLPESFKKKLNINCWGGGGTRADKSSGNLTARRSRHRLPPALWVCTVRQHVPRSEPAASGLSLP